MTVYIDHKSIRQHCEMEFEQFAEPGETVTNKHGRYIYKNKGHSVLAVAHLDSVSQDTHFNHIELETGTWLLSRRMDDRLGAYVILDLLPKMGATFDVLLTEGEETGNTTARDFVSPKQYNWAFSFDRHGMGVVMYQYEDKELRKLVKEVGCETETGSFSDICALTHLMCKCVNWGTAYYDEHSEWARCNTARLATQVNKFFKFWRLNHSQWLKYVPFEKQKKKHTVVHGSGAGNPSGAGPIGRVYETLYWCSSCYNHVVWKDWVFAQNMCRDCVEEGRKSRAACKMCKSWAILDEAGFCEKCLRLQIVLRCVWCNQALRTQKEKDSAICDKCEKDGIKEIA